MRIYILRDSALEGDSTPVLATSDWTRIRDHVADGSWYDLTLPYVEVWDFTESAAEARQSGTLLGCVSPTRAVSYVLQDAEPMADKEAT